MTTRTLCRHNQRLQGHDNGLYVDAESKFGRILTDFIETIRQNEVLGCGLTKNEKVHKNALACSYWAQAMTFEQKIKGRKSRVVTLSL